MNWQKLSLKYPKAYKHMEDNFKCLFTNKELTSVEYGVPRYGGTIKHPLKRDLYDFFDGEDIMTNVTPLLHTFEWFADDYNSVKFARDYGECETRSEAETEAFTKAFEILEERL